MIKIIVKRCDVLKIGSTKPAIVEFAASKYAVLESDKLVKVGVQRSGNLTCTASVK